jgi:hypothetical protein
MVLVGIQTRSLLKSLMEIPLALVGTALVGTQTINLSKRVPVGILQVPRFVKALVGMQKMSQYKKALVGTM